MFAPPVLSLLMAQEVSGKLGGRPGILAIEAFERAGRVCLDVHVRVDDWDTVPAVCRLLERWSITAQVLADAIGPVATHRFTLLLTACAGRQGVADAV